MSKAVCFQRFATLVWLQKNTTRLGPQHILQRAARHQNTDILTWILAVWKEIPIIANLETVARYGRLECLPLLSRHAAAALLVKYISAEIAARNGRLYIVEWLHSNSSRLFTSTMDVAAQFGHLDVVRWLHRNQRECCTTSTTDLAAHNGHIDVVKWLTRNREEGCSNVAMLFSILSGRLDMVQWIYTNFEKAWVGQLIDIAATSGRLSIPAVILLALIGLLKEVSAAPLMQSFPPPQTAIYTCCAVRFDHGFDRRTPQAMDSAAANGHVTVLRWLHDRGFVCSTNAIDLTAMNSHKDVVCWLNCNTSAGCTESAMDGAATQGHFAVLVYLNESCKALVRRSLGVLRFSDGCVFTTHILSTLQK
ncbi:hypothetical protein PHMEG_00029545 [Phytophthora megakarya]|uniref:Uncharacterized protein n=1 Tax=Phytophthora megakarya TaxID=4795 RepID=A0A225V3C0_9STRA|nr:hypothetical protein PHMEG_00029545 [Phytophthora megakarya]